MRKPKIEYKRGQKVVFVRFDSSGISLTDGVVSQVRTDPQWGYTVHVKHTVCFRPGQENVWNYAFVENLHRETYTGYTQRYPLWMLRSLGEDENIKKLIKRAEKATNLNKQYRNRYDEISRQVDYESHEWKRQQIEQRTKGLTHNWDFLQNVVSRLGFKKPRERKVQLVQARG